MKKISIDPGHGGVDSGAVNRLIYEKTINLEVAKYLADELITRGYEVKLLRTADYHISEEEKAIQSNEFDADFYLAVHCNSFSSPNAEGIETWHFAQASIAKKFQDAMMKCFIGHKDRGVKQGNFWVLKATDCPAILIEMEFLSNPVQSRFLIDPATQKIFAHIFTNVIDRIW